MTIRIEVDTHHKGCFGDPDYSAPAIRCTFGDEGHWDHICLAAAKVLFGLQSMYDGDPIALRVYRHDVLMETFEGKVSRVNTSNRIGGHVYVDAALEEIACNVERWA